MTTITINPHKNIAYSFFTLTIAVLLLTIFGLAQGLYQATIIISAKRHTLETTFNATFRAQILQENLEAKETFIPKTVVSMEDFATGEVTIINNSAQNQTLVANTRLLSANELLFRLTSKINVPAYQKTRANVRADKPGQEYEIGPSRFTIPGLSPILQTKIYAESKNPMTGGFKKTGIVTQKDLDDAKNSLKENLQKKALADIEKKNTDSNLKPILHSEITELLSDTKANEEKEKFTVKMTLRVTTALIPEKELTAKTREGINEHIPAGQKSISLNRATLAYQLKSYDLENQKAVVGINIAGQTILNETNDALAKERFTNKTKDEIKQYLQNLDDVQSVEIQFSPFFVKRAPKSGARINIKII